MGLLCGAVPRLIDDWQRASHGKLGFIASQRHGRELIVEPATIEKAQLATKYLLNRDGYRILEEGYELRTGGIVDFIALDTKRDEYVFIFAGIDEGEYPEFDRDACVDVFERAALDYFAHMESNEEAGKPVRCDIILIALVNENRIVMRHQHGITGASHGE